MTQCREMCAHKAAHDRRHAEVWKNKLIAGNASRWKRKNRDTKTLKRSVVGCRGAMLRMIAGTQRCGGIGLEKYHSSECKDAEAWNRVDLRAYLVRDTRRLKRWRYRCPEACKHWGPNLLGLESTIAQKTAEFRARSHKMFEIELLEVWRNGCRKITVADAGCHWRAGV